MIRTKKQCVICGQMISSSNITVHVNSHSKKGSKRPRFSINKRCVLENGLYPCIFCDKNFTLKGISTHIWLCHMEDGKLHLKNSKLHLKNIISDHYKNKTFSAKNTKGKTYEEIYGIERASEIRKKLSLASKKQKSHKCSPEQRKKISESMKKAHAEGRAHNIGQCRWNNEPSYPEKYMISIIEDVFDDKNYIREFPIGKYSIDFAWIDKKKAIEIDGDQHNLPDQKQRDMKKDLFLYDQKWDVLRVSWKEFSKDKNKFIFLMNDFIGEIATF